MTDIKNDTGYKSTSVTLGYLIRVLSPHQRDQVRYVVGYTVAMSTISGQSCESVIHDAIMGDAERLSEDYMNPSRTELEKIARDLYSFYGDKMDGTNTLDEKLKVAMMAIETQELKGDNPSWTMDDACSYLGIEVK